MSEKASVEFAVAVLGAMNPAIHTPDWYRYLDLISDEELATSKGAGLAVSQIVAQFTAPSFQIICNEGKWMIRAGESEAERATDIATRVFDALDQTPVSAYGINLTVHTDTGLEDIQTRLLKRLGGMLAVDEDLQFCTIKYSIPVEGRVLNVVLEPSQKHKSALFVALNYHYPTRAKEFEKFDLGPLIKEAATRDTEDYMKRCKSLVDAISSEGA